MRSIPMMQEECGPFSAMCLKTWMKSSPLLDPAQALAGTCSLVGCWQRVHNSLSFGGGCINDTIIHLSTPHLGFGGVGDSGMGRYHGKFSFDTFTHYKSILKKSAWLDLPVRYHPYTDGKFKLLRRFLR